MTNDPERMDAGMGGRSDGNPESGGADGRRPVAASANAAAPGVDLDAVIAGLLASPEWTREDRSSVSVLQSPPLRVVVTALHDGATLHNDDPDEVMTVQGLRGEAVLSVNEQGATLAEGALVAVPSGVPWRLVARSDAVVLLTVARH